MSLKWKEENFHRNVLSGKKFIREILNAVRIGKLKEPFYPENIRNIVKGYAEQTYKLFPWKHCLQNSNRTTTALFYYMGERLPKPRSPTYEKRIYRLLRHNDFSKP